MTGVALPAGGGSTKRSPRHPAGIQKVRVRDSTAETVPERGDRRGLNCLPAPRHTTAGKKFRAQPRTSKRGRPENLGALRGRKTPAARGLRRRPPSPPPATPTPTKPSPQP